MTEEEFFEKLGKKIKLARKRKRKTQEELGELVGLSRASLIRLEGGSGQEMSLKHLRRISQALGADLSNLIRVV